MRTTKFPNGLESFLLDIQAVIKKAAYTVVQTTDSGKTFTNGETDGVVFSLQSITGGGSTGDTMTFVNTAADGAADLTLSPVAGDNIGYAGTAVNGKDMILTKATSKQGDFVTIAAEESAGWKVTACRGIWTKEA